MKTDLFGIINALNLGLSNASGEFIARIDSDDLMSKYRLQKQVEILRKYGDDLLVHSGYKIIDEEKKMTLMSLIKNL